MRLRNAQVLKQSETVVLVPCKTGQAGLEGRCALEGDPASVVLRLGEYYKHSVGAQSAYWHER